MAKIQNQLRKEGLWGFENQEAPNTEMKSDAIKPGGGVPFGALAADRAPFIGKRPLSKTR